MKYNSEYIQAFNAMIKRQEKIIFNVSFFYATKEMPFEDLRQEILISLFKAYNSFRNDCAESTWTYKICINTCLFNLRCISRKVRTVPIEEIQGINLEEESDMEFRLKVEWLYNAISQLSPLEKTLILMWLDELSYDEIAANIGIPRNTVASKLYRIKEKLSSKKDI